MPKCRLCGGRRPWLNEAYGTARTIALAAHRFGILADYLDELPLGPPEGLDETLRSAQAKLLGHVDRLHPAVHGDGTATAHWRAFVRGEVSPGFEEVVTEAMATETAILNYLNDALAIRPQIREQMLDRLDANARQM